MTLPHACATYVYNIIRVYTRAQHNMNLQLESADVGGEAVTFKCECIQIQPQMQPHTYSLFITTMRLNYATGLPREPQIFNNFSIFKVQRRLLEWQRAVKKGVGNFVPCH